MGIIIFLGLYWGPLTVENYHIPEIILGILVQFEVCLLILGSLGLSRHQDGL